MFGCIIILEVSLTLHDDLFRKEGAVFYTPKGYQQQSPWVGIANTNHKLMMQAAAEFGLTPSARSRIIAGNAKKEDVDEMEFLLTGGA